MSILLLSKAQKMRRYRIYREEEMKGEDEKLDEIIGE